MTSTASSLKIAESSLMLDAIFWISWSRSWTLVSAISRSTACSSENPDSSTGGASGSARSPSRSPPPFCDFSRVIYSFWLLRKDMESACSWEASWRWMFFRTRASELPGSRRPDLSTWSLSIRSASRNLSVICFVRSSISRSWAPSVSSKRTKRRFLCAWCSLAIFCSMFLVTAFIASTLSTQCGAMVWRASLVASLSGSRLRGRRRRKSSRTCLNFLVRFRVAIALWR
mmetsp:Transcript_6585/g.16789  ORF Transcript_6585/g.16789 Transcript_6585/m.16789 type:complete len:229 (+) Transcript_6585:231-917(+)